METASNILPKIIWFLWFQGYEKAPYVVKKCLASWRENNPGWKIVFLEEQNLKEYIDTKEIIGGNDSYVSRQALSDIIRINLLKKYGGVWVDSTCFCCNPLDDWLDSYMNNGFFAFDRPRIDVPISSWFLASCLGSQLTSAYCEEVNSYWSKNCFSNQNNMIGKLYRVIFEIIFKHINCESTIFLFLCQFVKKFKIYPYFWFHHVFAFLIMNNNVCKKEWRSIKKYSADIPHKLQHFGLFKPLSEQIKMTIDEKRDPLYKLTWRYDENEYTPTCTLSYLLEH